MIGVITNTDYSANRTNSILQTWGPDFLNSTICGELVFCTRNLDEERFSSKIINLPLSNEVNFLWESVPLPNIGFWEDFWISRNYIVILRTVTLVNYFADSQNSGWFVRLVDDAFVNVPQLPEMIFSINEQYDPINDIVVMGNCIEVEANFLQGGSGFLFSLRAAYFFKSYSLEWLRNMNTLEDWHFTNFLTKIGWPLWNASSPYFLGHLFDATRKAIFDYRLLPKGNFSLPVCDFAPYAMQTCRAFYAPLSHVVFFHDVDHIFNHRSMKHFLNYYARGVYFTQPGQGADICQSSNKNETVYVDNSPKIRN